MTPKEIFAMSFRSSYIKSASKNQQVLYHPLSDSTNATKSSAYHQLITWFQAIAQKVYGRLPADLLAEQHNAQHSMLYRLPAELLLLISEFLPSTDLIAFRMVSVKFRRLIKSPKLTEKDHFAFQTILRRASLREGCQRERDGRLPRSHIMCGTCMTSHPKSLFEPNEWSKSPEARMCIGSQGVVQVCSHIKVTFAGARISPVNFVCARAHPQNNMAGDPVHVSMRCSKNCEQEVVIEREYPLLVVAKDSKVTHGMLMTAMDQIREPICPHLFAHQSSILQNQFSSCSARFENGEKRSTVWLGEISRFAEAHGWAGDCHVAYHYCPNKHCVTSLMFYRTEDPEKPEEYDRVILTVVRSLGALQSPTDSKWIAQLARSEDPSSENCLVNEGGNS
ncbi:hypothetical protein K432DRAFT_42946 [Lepidopterella palustris CBS 459.81]|uniref:F-box domain-containing protein n=1 Tax=Lepidopterella palustris CBS 459.81 TaxID=1314670 RepID=A0A8E2EAL8_9PEZI|nr:hypothetical protein K432DRAFT_42946 [Lepidopterella palustris CBS 459.81]